MVGGQHGGVLGHFGHLVDPQFPGSLQNPRNVGDNSASTVRLRRTWDTWSTDYTNAPASAVDPRAATLGQPYGMSKGQAPIYPSYSPPYPTKSNVMGRISIES